MRQHISAFEQHLATFRSRRTVRTYGSTIASFCDFKDGPGPTRRDIESFLARPRMDGRARSVATRNQELAALRAFYHFASRELGETVNPTDGVPFARAPARDPAVLSVAEVRRLFNAAALLKPEGDRARAVAVLAVLSQAGLRVHELVALNTAHIDLCSATLVGVCGKGGTVHDVPLNSPTLSLLMNWLAHRAELAEAGEAALFVSRRGTRISIRTVQRLVAALRAAIRTSKKITPHTLRHTMATLALASGSDLSTVADLLRHTDLNTTRLYLHLVDERRREAVGRLSVAIPAELISKRHTSVAESRPDLRSFHPSPLDVQYGLEDIADAA